MYFLKDEDYYENIMRKKPSANATLEEINRLDEEQQDAFNNYMINLCEKNENEPEPDWNYWAGEYEERLVNWSAYKSPFLLQEMISLGKYDKNNDLIYVFGSVAEIPDELFTQPMYSVLLPPFSAKIAYATGYASKDILIKRVIFNKNYSSHKDLRCNPTKNKFILENAIYHADMVIFNTPSKPDYRIALKLKDKYLIVNLDFTSDKKYTEVIGWYTTDTDGYNRILNRAVKTNGFIHAVKS